jgi:hypothetical protein
MRREEERETKEKLEVRMKCWFVGLPGVSLSATAIITLVKTKEEKRGKRREKRKEVRREWDDKSWEEVRREENRRERKRRAPSQPPPSPKKRTGRSITLEKQRKR